MAKTMADLTVSQKARSVTLQQREVLAGQLAQMENIAEVIEAVNEEVERVHCHTVSRVSRTLKVAGRRRHLRTTPNFSDAQYEQMTQQYLSEVFSIVGKTDVELLQQLARCAGLDDVGQQLEAPDFVKLDDGG